MAKDKITDYDATAANNLDVGGISVAEGMLPSGVNNAIRELMSHQKEAFGSGTPLYVDQVNNRVGINQATPAHPVHVGTDDLIVDASGNLLVGGTSLGENGAVTMAGDGRLYAIRASDTAGFFGRTSTDGSIVNFTKDGTTVGAIGSRDAFLTIYNGDTGLGFDAANDHIRPVTSTGSRDNAIDLGRSATRFKDLYLSGGVYLGGTGSANQLSDYEEGSWTPNIREASRSTSVTYSSISAQYIKIGTQVTLTLRTAISTHDGATSGTLWRVYGFPFTPNSDAGTFTVYNNNSGTLVGYGRMETSTYGAVGIIAIPTNCTLHSTFVYTTNS